MALLGFSVSSVIVLQAAILSAKFLSLYSGWIFWGPVNCQGDSSYLEDMDVVDYSALSAFGNDYSGMQNQDINECCKECQDDQGGCIPNCHACDVVEGATFLKLLKPISVDERHWGFNGFWRNYGNDTPNPIHHQPYDNSNRYGNDVDTLPPRLCCADCEDGDIYCLSNCETYGCKPTSVCADAGSGAYGSFCQRECMNDYMVGYSAVRMDFLPERPCRANCVKYVQRMCAMKNCRDYGCEVYNCADRAAYICG